MAREITFVFDPEKQILLFSDKPGWDNTEMFSTKHHKYRIELSLLLSVQLVCVVEEYHSFYILDRKYHKRGPTNVRARALCGWLAVFLIDNWNTITKSYTKTEMEITF